MSKPQIDPKYFQSITGLPNCTFFAIAPEGTKLQEVFTDTFWKRVAETPACQGRLHVDDLVRIRATDRLWDVQLVVSGLRKDGSPLLLRWPIDPYAAPKPQLQTAMPTTLVQACEALGVALDATPEDIKRIGDALRVANHPDHARDEHDRQRRQYASKRINCALDLLLKRRAA